MTETGDREMRRRQVPAVTRAIGILRQLGKANEPVGVNQIARDLELIPSTCLHILRVLVDEGLVEFDPVSKRYSIDVGILPIARSAIQKNNFANIVERRLTELSMTFGVTGIATQMSDAERAAFRAEVRAYLMDNPEVIFEAAQQLEQRQAEAEAKADLEMVKANSEEIFHDGFSWVGGNPDGDITLVEFMDYRCGYCRKAVPEIAALLEKDGNIRLIVKEFPILGEASMISSRFAIATKQVAGDEAYGQVHDALMEMQGDLTDVVLRRLAEGLGLDAEAILAKMESPEVTEEIAKTRALAQKLRISGTPTFVLEDELLRGYLPAAHLETIVSEKREAK